MMFHVRSASLDVRTELYERAMVPKETHGTETWGMRIDERMKLGVMEVK